VNRQVINGEEFNKIGTSSPKEVQELTKIKEVKIGDLTLTPQVQQQHDYAFLLDKTESQISSAISEVAKTSGILKATKLCTADIRERKSKLKHKKEDLSNAQELLELVNDDYFDVKVQEKDISKSLAVIETTEEELTLLKEYSDIEETVSSVSKDIGITCNLDFGNTEKEIEDLEAIEAYLVLLPILDLSIDDLDINFGDSIEDSMGILGDIEEFLICMKEAMELSESAKSLLKDTGSCEKDLRKLEKELGVCPLCEKNFEVCED